MKHVLTLSLLVMALSASGQAVMNIFRNNGPLLQVPVSDIDSITYSGLEYLNPNLTYGTVTDQNGNTYATIVIGTQEWMAENLRATTYANGDPIPNLADAGQWLNAVFTSTGAWAHYENNPSYDVPYGKLYNAFVTTDPRNVCPSGWHVPTDAEWTLLSNYLGGDAVAGGKMKSPGIVYWDIANFGATNESGFSGLGAGYRHDQDASFTYARVTSTWWSSTQWGGPFQYFARRISETQVELFRPFLASGYGLSIRCIRD